MKVVFRVDESNQIGSGHIMRCLTLAKALSTHGANCAFICRDLVGNFSNKITEANFQLFLLPKQEKNERVSNQENTHTNWLGCDWEIDAKQTQEFLAPIQPDWLVVDHYSLDVKWESYLQENYQKLIVIDDLADRQHNCDVLLDQNLYADMASRYKGKIPNHCIQLFGPQYALLHPCYANLRKQAKPRTFPLKNLLVFFGGFDSFNITGLVLEALENLPTPFESINIVISKQSLHYEQIRNRIKDSSNIQLHSDIPSLAELILKADLAIGAGGSTTWERCCLGLPTLVVTVAQNQRPVSHHLNQLGLVSWVADASTVQPEHIIHALKKCLSMDNISLWSKQCMDICSGQGSNQVVKTMLEFQKMID